MINQNKKTQVDALTSNIEKSKSFLVIKIDRTTHQNLENMRRELRKTGSKVKVIKNAYFEKAINKLAAKNKLYSELRKNFLPLETSSGIIFLDEAWDQGLKAFYEFSQKEKTLSFKFSLIDSNIYNTADTEKIAKLPGRDQLVAKILGSMKAPTSKFVYSLKYNTNKLVYILQAKAKEVKS